MKKNILYFLLFIIGIYSCKKENTDTGLGYNIGSRGQIISSTLKYSLDTIQVKQLIQQKLGSFSSFVNIKYGVSVYNITYKSLNYKNDTVKASGLVIVPHLSNYNVPLCSYQHGTILKKTDVTSIRFGQEYYLNMVVAAQQGMVACLPDYLGLGLGDGFHLYLNSIEESNSVVDILRAARYLVNSTKETYLNEQVFLYGYSQGGHATMAAQKEIETKLYKEFKLTASAPMAGPYCLSKTSQFNVMVDSIYYPNPFYLPYVAMSLNNVYGQQYNLTLSDIFKKPYDSIIPAIINGNYSSNYANSKFPTIPSLMVKDSLKIVLRNNPNHPLRLALKNMDLDEGWTPKAATRLYHCSGDDNVFYDNAVCAYNTFKARGGNIELIDMGNANHEDCAPPSLFIGVTWFNDFINLQKR